MRCERYWRDGVLLVEQGRPDPHRDECLDCRREHEARGELVRAIGTVSARRGDPRWQARVWRRIAELDAPRHPTWIPWAGALAAAAVLVLIVWTQAGPHGAGGGEREPGFEIIPSELAMRSTSAGIGDRVRIRVRATQEARIYRAEKLLLRCTAPAAAATPGCSRDGGDVLAEFALALPGDYQLVIAPAGIGEPAGSLEADMAAITAAHGKFQVRELTVR
jgi:hypothetical protein